MRIEVIYTRDTYITQGETYYFLILRPLAQLTGLYAAHNGAIVTGCSLEEQLQQILAKVIE